MKKYNLENILMFRKQFVLTLIVLVVARQVNAQTVVYSEDFESEITGVVTTTINTSTYYQLQFNDACTMWNITSSGYGNSINCAGCTGKWVEHDYSLCVTNNIFVTPNFIPNGSSIDISFDYGYNYYSGDYFRVMLWNETDNVQVGADLLNLTSDAGGSYTGTVVLTGTNSPSDEYTLNFDYYQYNDWGAGFDNILVTTCPSFATYYSKSSGNLDDLSTWGSNADGTGCSPDNFTTAGVTYNVHNNTAPTTSGAWAVSGTGSKVVFGDPDVTVSFTTGGALDFDCDIELANDGALNLDDNNMNLEGDLIRSSASAVFNPGPSGTNSITFDGGTDQYVNVTTAGGSTPADADLTFYDVVVNNNSTVRLYYKFSNSKKLNINDLNVNSGSTLHFISD